jgi:hypothetical protein
MGPIGVQKSDFACMKMAAEGRGFSPAVTGNSLSPDPSRERERGTTKWWVRALTAGLKPRPWTLAV